MKSCVRACARFSIPAALLALAGVVAAQGDYPTRPVHLVVPFAAGSGVDLVARGLAQRLGEQTKTAFIVENRDGAGGTLGAVAVAKATADGYSLLFTASPPYAVGPAVQGSSAYDPNSDFVPVSKVAATSMVLIANNDAPFKSLAELASYSKANPGKLNYATTGIGTPSHLSVEVIKERLGLNIEPVHYKSAGQAMTDTIAGHVPLYMPSYPAAQAYLQAGKVKGLAIGSPMRAAGAPDIPTLAEALKQPGPEIRVWYGLLAPKGTPRAVVDRLASEVAKAATAPEIVALVSKMGAEPLLVGPADFATQIRAEVTSSRQLVQKLGIAEK
ncbi:tripartite tricarboxylate transporter substrate binding protein [Variovorax sp. dw_308]|uniref:Bug family tripartite tricarboxylate transporter substrate binding protein n=1 Tax=Variovorax sp. dw_308 TaxID=2721546 RepID=UPI001C43BF04|nr:tripartite tricarboxylate transporter substrate binding protein [Variovorax sp. dw_308]